MLKKNHFDNYLFRCHNFGNILSKSGKLTETGKTELDKIFNYEWYGFKRNFSSKETRKGIENEIDALQLLKNTIAKDISFAIPDIKTYSNRSFKGTPDKTVGYTVYDVKCPWDIETFEKSDLSHVYEWQLKCYMALTGCKNAILFYALTNTPIELVKNETRYMSEYEAFEYRIFHNFDYLPISQRFKYFEITLTFSDLRKMVSTVKMARNYLNDLVDAKIKEVYKNIKKIENNEN